MARKNEFSPRISLNAKLPKVSKNEPVSAFSLQGRVLLIGKDHNGSEVYRHESDNLIVNTADLLAAELFSGINGPVPEITHFAIGVGLSSWSPQSPPDPVKEQAALFNEIFRTTVTPFYVDSGTGDPVAPQVSLDPDGVNIQRTSLVDFRITLASGDANGALKEMGLFGGVAAGLTNKGTMINHYTFPEWNKIAGQTLDIVWRLSFRHTNVVPEFGNCAVTCQATCETDCQTVCQLAAQ